MALSLKKTCDYFDYFDMPAESAFQQTYSCYFTHF